MNAQRPGARRMRPRLSTLLSLSLVVAAGVVAWYGWRPLPSPPPAPAGPAATIAAEAPRVIEPGAKSGLPTRLVVPSAGIDTQVDEVGVARGAAGAYWQTAWRAAGHHLDSALPGNPGNVVLTGHVSVANPENLAVFADLDKVAVGDLVEVYSGEARYTYRVDAVLRVSPETTGVLRGDHTARVTLITCTKDLEDRLVVVGSLVG